jgi:23S rRNA pseudouridine1911/1915/1917 synthase
VAEIIRMAKTFFTVKKLKMPARLDKVIAIQYPQWGRKAVKKLISSRKVKVDKKSVWLGSWEVQNGQKIEISEAPVEKPKPIIKFNEGWLLSDEDDLIAMNKPAGLLSQTTRAGGKDNLLDLCIEKFGKVALFHRLDRDTSGLCLLTRPGEINAYLDKLFKQRRVVKEYLALVSSQKEIDAEGVIKTRLRPHPRRRDQMVVVGKGGFYAESRYEVLGESEGKKLIRIWPITGRSHQLRVQMSYLGVPIIGDRIYGGGEKTGLRLMLHAHKIELPAADGFETRSFSAPLGEDFKQLIPTSLINLLP